MTNARFSSSSMTKSVFAKKSDEWLGDLHKILYESLVEADVPKKALQISYGSRERKVLDDLYLGLIRF